jgi:hypothetical protein
MFHGNFQYISLDTIDQMKAAIVSGTGFVGAFHVTDDFYNGGRMGGDVPAFDPNAHVYGDHEIFFCGYDDTTQRFSFKNSWSDSLIHGVLRDRSWFP